MVRFNRPSSGSVLLCFAKLLKWFVKNAVRYQFGRVAAYLSSLYWCVYSVQCTVSVLLVCVCVCVCTVQSAE